MKRTLLFKLIITLAILIFSLDGQPCPCSGNGNILQCNVINTSPTVDTTSCNLQGYNSIKIVYTGNVILNLIASSTMPIVIQPVDGTNGNTLQISSINTNAADIEIQIYLSINQASVSLFTTTSSIIAPTSTLSIDITQNIVDASSFTVFGYPSSTTMNFSNYEINFDTTSANSGSLYLNNLIYGLKTLTSITISGNNHILLVNSAQMPSSINVNQLSLKSLSLYDQILVNFYNLQEYSIEQCEYNGTSLFLNSTQTYDLSLEMINNNPLDSVLPFGKDAFKQLGTLTSLILIEPTLDSSCLEAIRYLSYPGKVLINLNEYDTSDLIDWGEYKPIIWDLTIQNIKNLSVFPPAFFNKFQAIQHLMLQGTFDLEKPDIYIFVGINIQPNAQSPIVILNSSNQTPNDWNNCADTYIKAINQRSTNNVMCSPNNTAQDCQAWADATAQCDLVDYENTYKDQIEIYGNNFFYYNSYLYQFFTKRLWLNNTTYTTASPGPTEGGVNIGAIVGALCGLLVAVIILALTLFCIYRYRQKDARRNMYAAPQVQYKPSSYDSTHVSIATSKTSQSSRQALAQSFFPPIQPNDEIAPPLYSAPSESVGSVSAYNLPSAPPRPRASVSTQATHLYETLDP